MIPDPSLPASSKSSLGTSSLSLCHCSRNLMTDLRRHPDPSFDSLPQHLPSQPDVLSGTNICARSIV